MLFNAGRSLTATLIVFLLTQISYAELREIESKVVFTSRLPDGEIDIFVMDGNTR